MARTTRLDSLTPLASPWLPAALTGAFGEVRVRVTVPTQNGWKAIALSAGARQELFISTTLSKDELLRALERATEG